TPGNPEAHYRTTGPEIWEQTEGRVTHFVCAPGTGGTVSGAGRFLKEKNPAVRVIAGDPAGSIYAEYARTHRKTEGAPYKVEGIGGDKIPSALQFDVVDEWITVGDTEGTLLARRLAREGGVVGGGSTGADGGWHRRGARRRHGRGGRAEPYGASARGPGGPGSPGARRHGPPVPRRRRALAARAAHGTLEARDPGGVGAARRPDRRDRDALRSAPPARGDPLMKVTVLTGGATAERVVAFASAAQVVAALRQRQHEVRVVDTVSGLLAVGAE